jgi:imidazolonepropionase-like amidohydrolase
MNDHKKKLGSGLALALLVLGATIATGCGPRVVTVQITATPSQVLTPDPPPCVEAGHGSADLETPDAAPLALVGGTLIDGTGADPLPDAALVILGKCIVAVGPRAEVEIPADAQVIDVQGATILPGFFNAHVHNAYGRRNARDWARAGVTTVRDLGAHLGFPYFAMRDRLRTDPQYARVVSAGPLVTVPGGYPIVPNDFSSLTVISPEDAREQVAQLIADGADVIKITMTSGDLPTLSPEEASAIVQTAHERGVPVTVHATSRRTLERALEAGVDDVAHMADDRVPDRVIQRMVEAGVAWVPTLEALGDYDESNLRRFLAAGGVVALGNDAGYLSGLEIGMPMDEIELLEQAGMTPMQIILAATRDAARVCRLDGELGTLEASKTADVLVVDGDPLQDLQVLTDVLLVVHEGTIIRSEVPE